MKSKKLTLTVIDLFSGCGGLSAGFEKAGFNVLAAFDFWDPALEIYKKNFKHPVYKHDLSEVSSTVCLIRKYNPHAIIGGPPCQDFSHAGKRSEGKRANLTVKFGEIVAAVRPSIFVMENVDRIQRSSAYKKTREIFKKANYGLTEIVLDASYCGVPQKRKRFFCIGKLNESDGFAEKLIHSKLSEKPMTIRDYLGNELGLQYYYRHPRNYSRRAVFSIDEPAPTIRGVNRPVPAGYKGHHGDPVAAAGLRPLTTEERARIQTFSKDFIWVGSKTDKEQIIGNAVPVELAHFIASCVLESQCK